MKKITNTSFHNKTNISHDSSIRANSYTEKKKSTASSHKKHSKQWNQLLDQISIVTNKVKKLYNDQDYKHNKSKSPCVSRKSSNINSSYRKNSRVGSTPIVNCFQQVQKHNKTPIRRQIQRKNSKIKTPSRNKSNSSYRKINQTQSGKKYNKSFVDREEDSFLENLYHNQTQDSKKMPHIKSFIEIQTQQASCYSQSEVYGAILSKYQQLQKTNYVLEKQKQILLQKLCAQSQQKKQLQMMMSEFKKKNLIDNDEINEALRNKIPTQRKKITPYLLSSNNNNNNNKENFSSKTPKKNYQDCFIANRQILGAKNMNRDQQTINRNNQQFVKVNEQSHLCSFSEVFTSKCFQNEQSKHLINQQDNKAQSLLIDLSNRSSASHKNQPPLAFMKNQTGNFSRSYESIELEKQLLSLLKRSKFEKDKNNKKDLRMKIYQILSEYGIEQ